MAIKNFTQGGVAALPVDALNRFFLIERKIDFSKAEFAHSAADVLEVLNIPANTLVLGAGHIVHTAEGATAAGTLGDGADPDGYVAASNLNSAAVQRSQLALTEGTPNTVAGYSNGKFYSAADTIDYVATDVVDAAVVTFFALAVKIG